MKHRKASHNRPPHKASSAAKPPTFPHDPQGLTLEEMATHIAALRRPPHLSPNPLSGNSLY